MYTCICTYVCIYVCLHIGLFVLYVQKVIIITIIFNSLCILKIYLQIYGYERHFTQTPFKFLPWSSWVIMTPMQMPLAVQDLMLTQCDCKHFLSNSGLKTKTYTLGMIHAILICTLTSTCKYHAQCTHKPNMMHYSWVFHYFIHKTEIKCWMREKLRCINFLSEIRRIYSII